MIHEQQNHGCVSLDTPEVFYSTQRQRRKSSGHQCESNSSGDDGPGMGRNL